MQNPTLNFMRKRTVIYLTLAALGGITSLVYLSSSNGGRDDFSSPALDQNTSATAASFAAEVELSKNREENPAEHYELYKERFVHYLGGARSTYPRNPLDVYKNNLAAAGSGDGAAMYAVHLALDTCAGLLRDGFEFDAYIAANPSISSEVLHMQQARDFCGDLWGELPDEDLIALARDWKTRSAQAGYPVAQLELIVDPTSKIRSRKDLDALALATARVGTPAALSAVTAYVQAYTQAQEIETKIPVEAWDLVTCRENPNCNPRAFRNMSLGHLLPVRVEEIVRSADLLQQQITAGTLKQL